MKYFQALADIRNHYDDVLKHMDEPKFGHFFLESWEIDAKEKEKIIEEKEALRYLTSCHLMLAGDENAKKPTVEVVNRCLNRHMKYLEKIHKCDQKTVKTHPSKFIQKEYKACKHYLFQFSLPAWYEKMPNEVLTFENKYPDF